jgi:hypothetical protein
MDDSHVGLQAAIRALSDVVAPAVDPQHAQAGDQLRLAAIYLGFLAQRLDHLHARNRWELGHHLEMATALQPIAQAGGMKAAQALKAGVAHAERLLAGGNASTEALRAATAQLAAAVSGLVQESADGNEATRSRIEQQVLQASQQRIAFDRAWYQPLRLDPDTHEIRPLSDFLSAA